MCVPCPRIQSNLDRKIHLLLYSNIKISFVTIENIMIFVIYLIFTFKSSQIIQGLFEAEGTCFNYIPDRFM